MKNRVRRQRQIWNYTKKRRENKPKINYNVEAIENNDELVYSMLNFINDKHVD